MITAILWKEYREHRLIWATLALVGAALLLGLPAVLAPGGLHDRPDLREAICFLATGLAWVYGMICGALLLAGEREAGTLPFLDALPGRRRRLWVAKVMAGAVLVAAQAAFLLAVAAAARLFESWAEPAWTVAGMAYFGLFGFAWGLLFSSFGRSVMSMILLSFFAQLALSFFGGCLAMPLAGLMRATFGPLPADDLGLYPMLLTGWIGLFSVPAALGGSWLIFTRLDRSRFKSLPEPTTRVARRPRVSWTVLFWLAWRQARGFTAGLALFALLLGFLVPFQGILVWPMATLLVGVLCGVTTFAPEQEGPYRFLGDQRLPLGKFWLVKVGLRFAVAVGAAVIVLTPSVLIALGRAAEYGEWQGGNRAFIDALLFYTFRTALIGAFWPPGLFLGMWLVAGFAAGCLYGVLFRNGLPSGVFAMSTAALLTALWVPSLLTGGLHLWQVFGPPALLLLSTLWLLRPWVAGRIASGSTAFRLIPFVALAALLTAAGVWYRVAEIPNVPEKADLDAFRARLTTAYKNNEGGDRMRQAGVNFQTLGHKLNSEMPSARAAQKNPWETTVSARLADVLEHGWTADPERAAWLDKLFAGEWVGMLTRAADLPPGMVVDLPNATEFTRLPVVDSAEDIATALAARGLQRQAAGDDTAYVENLRVGLSLSRAMRGHDAQLGVLRGRNVEAILVKGLDRWLEKLNGKPDLLQKATEHLSRYLDATVDDGADQDLVDDLILRNTADDPVVMQEIFLNGGEMLAARNDPAVKDQAQWVGLAQLVPWERERRERMLRVLFWGDNEQRRALGLGPLQQLGPSPSPRAVTPMERCQERATLLKLALRWYQSEAGKPADNLDQLIPKYMDSIPTDPFDGLPFRYRLSKGEEIEWPEEPAVALAPAPAAGAAAVAPPMMNAPGMGMAGAPAAQAPHTRKIPPGQGILWSVGNDKHDDGGHRQTASPQGQTAPGEDVIFLVPLPPADK